MSLIGIIGNIGSGKSTVSEYLVNNYNYEEYSFASPIKNIAINMGFDYNQVYGSQINKLEINKYWGISGREFMQKIGTEFGRNIIHDILPNMNIGKSNSLWVKIFEIKYENHVKTNNNKSVVVSDCRFENEIQSIRDRGGYIIKIVRDKATPVANEKKIDDKIYNHSSEMHISNLYYDSVINNNTTKDDLFESIDCILRKINS